MAITITAALLVLYALWAWRRTGKISGPVARASGKQKKACIWEQTGHRKGRFVEFQCKTCGVSAMPHTGKPPLDCKRNLQG